MGVPPFLLPILPQRVIATGTARGFQDLQAWHGMREGSSMEVDGQDLCLPFPPPALGWGLIVGLGATLTLWFSYFPPRPLQIDPSLNSPQSIPLGSICFLLGI